MKIALAQINPWLGNYAYNAGKISSSILKAQELGASLVVFSEMCLFGYPAYDLLEKSQEVESQLKELQKLNKAIPSGITTVFGAVTKNPDKKGKPYQNVAVVISKGRKPIFIPKQLLPSYDIFDDTRFFEPGKKTICVPINGFGKVAITVCEDMWGERQNYSHDPLQRIKGARLIINISASPFDPGKLKLRQDVAKSHAKKLKAPFVYVNQVGGQDELVFDGQSFILDKKGNLLTQTAAFKEDFIIYDLENGKSNLKSVSRSKEEDLKSALVLGIKDFILKTGQKKVHLGLSGGIDSALVACLAVEAVGSANVVGLMLPGPFSSEGSVSDSVELAKNLNIKTETISIQDYYKTGLGTLEELSRIAGGNKSIAEQNLQARLRGMILMMYSNLAGSMLLSTANKSELASGYSTLYGDSCGGLMPIGDLTKNQVYAVSKLYGAIPASIVEKAPSAELAPGQKDLDSLPPYKVLDAAVVEIVEKQNSGSTQVEKWLEEKLAISEFKRWQAPPILRVSEHAFGRGRRIPIARAKL